MARQGLKLGAVMGSLMAVLTGFFLYYVLIATPPATYTQHQATATTVASVHPQTGPVSDARMR
jgi:hypothetical protein